MSAAEESLLKREGPDTYDTIVVVGGGCYGSYYVRQLQRAARAGAIATRHVLVVDRDAECRVAGELRAEDLVVPTTVLVRDWREFFETYLEEAADARDDTVRDAIVPSPLMPHLMGEWLVSRATARAVDREVALRPFDALPSVPWDRAGDVGTHYVSFATWMCPVNCVEPRTCPHTRDARTWSLPESLEKFAESAPQGVARVVATLHCRHRVYGVGMFDTRDVTAADERIRRAAEAGPVDVVIGTVSHCHGALTRLKIGELATTANSHVR